MFKVSCKDIMMCLYKPIQKNQIMDLRVELIIVSKLIVSFLLGAFIGFDRERHGLDAGIRTYAAVCIGATLFTAVAGHLISDVTAASRVIANIVTGVGFLGAGIIWRRGAGPLATDRCHASGSAWCDLEPQTRNTTHPKKAHDGQNFNSLPGRPLSPAARPSRYAHATCR